MPSDLDRLDQAEQCHDDDPDRGAELLRGIDAAQLPTARWPSYAFLLNHVFGEKLALWPEALKLQRVLLRHAQPTPPAVLWRQGAAAAHLAGDVELERVMTGAFAEAAAAPLPLSRDLVRLTAAMYAVPTQAAPQAAETVLAALALLQDEAWRADGPLDAAVAACTNNIASTLLQVPPAELRAPALRSALAGAAEQSHRFWLRAGSWVNHERALYLRAMVCNALEQAQWARAHAQAGLALLDTHDSAGVEAIDRAFLELEQWHSCMLLRRHVDARESLARAEALVERFDDRYWRDAFDKRRRELAALHPRGAG